MDSLPFGLRYLCQVLYKQLLAKFPEDDPLDALRTVGYFIFYRFVGLAILAPDDFGLCDKDDISQYQALNLISISLFSRLSFRISVPFVKDLSSP